MGIKKAARYSRVIKQISELIIKSDNLQSRMATVNALLYHKMDGFFWVGFYMLRDGKLLVGPYQGPLACIELQKDTGVCWAGIHTGKPVIVADVHQFPGHIACDSRSNSEIVIPIKDADNRIIGVLDIDSRQTGNFDETDREYLEKIVDLLIK